MKKIILLVLISLIFSNIGFAEVRLIESVTLKKKSLKALLGGSFSVNTFCVDGYKFVMSKGGGGKYPSSRSMVQFFEERDGKSLPAKC